jgi:hypothetical protein
MFGTLYVIREREVVTFGLDDKSRRAAYDASAWPDFDRSAYPWSASLNTSERKARLELHNDVTIIRFDFSDFTAAGARYCS